MQRFPLWQTSMALQHPLFDMEMIQETLREDMTDQTVLRFILLAVVQMHAKSIKLNKLLRYIAERAGDDYVNQLHPSANAALTDWHNQMYDRAELELCRGGSLAEVSRLMWGTGIPRECLYASVHNRPEVTAWLVKASGLEVEREEWAEAYLLAGKLEGWSQYRDSGYQPSMHHLVRSRSIEIVQECLKGGELDSLDEVWCRYCMADGWVEGARLGPLDSLEPVGLWSIAQGEAIDYLVKRCPDKLWYHRGVKYYRGAPLEEEWIDHGAVSTDQPVSSLAEWREHMARIRRTVAQAA